MFDTEYVGNIVSDFLAQEPEYQTLKGKRDFLLQQLANHTGFFSRQIETPTQEETEILIDFIRIFLRTNPQYNLRPVHPELASLQYGTSKLEGVKDATYH